MSYIYLDSIQTQIDKFENKSYHGSLTRILNQIDRKIGQYIVELLEHVLEDDYLIVENPNLMDKKVLDTQAKLKEFSKFDDSDLNSKSLSIDDENFLFDTLEMFRDDPFVDKQLSKIELLFDLIK